eukprot:scaffold285_cov330-Pavlova_lutheri.AAC.142
MINPSTPGDPEGSLDCNLEVKLRPVSPSPNPSSKGIHPEERVAACLPRPSRCTWESHARRRR